MALTTCCTAWCSYQSAAWTRRSNRLLNEYNALERRAALLDIQGNQAMMIHAAMFMQLLAAQNRRQPAAREFLRRAFPARREKGL